MRAFVPNADSSDATPAGLERAASPRAEPDSFRALIELSADVVWRADADGRFDAAQHSFAAFTGMDAAGCAGLGWLEAVHPADRAACQPPWPLLDEAGGGLVAIRRILRRDGEYRRMLTRAVPVRDEDGFIREWLGADFDRSEQFASERRLAGVLERMGEALVVVDERGRVVQVNENAAALAGCARSDLIGGTLEDALGGLRDESLRSALGRAMKDRRPLFVDAWDEVQDRWFETRAYPTDEGFAVFRRDISERKRAELRSRFLSQVSKVLFASLDLRSTVETLAGLVVPELADACVVDLLVEGDRLDRVTVVHRDRELEALIRELPVEALSGRSSSHPFHRALATGKTVHIRDTDQAIARHAPPNWDAETVRQLTPTSVLVVPLQGRGEALGLLSLSTFGHRRRFDEHDRSIADALGQRVAIAIDNAQNWGRAQAELQERQRTEQALRASEERFRVAQHLSLDGFLVFHPYRDAEGRITDLVCDYANPAAERMLGRAPFRGLRLLEALPGMRKRSELIDRLVRVAETGEPQDAEYFYDDDGIRAWLRILAVPLGRDLAVSISDITRRKTAEQEQRSRARDLELLYETSRALAEARLDPARMLEALATRIAESIGDACVIRRLSDDGQRLEPVALHHSDPEVLESLRTLVTTLPLASDSGVHGHALARGRAVLVADGIDEHIEPGYRSYVRRHGLKSVIVAPLRIRGRTLGTIFVGRDGNSRPYRESDRIIVQEIAERAALSLENVRLFEVERQLRAAAEAGLERLTRLQRITAALSRALPQEDVLDVIVEQVLEAMGASAGGVLTTTADGREFRLLKSVGFAEDTPRRYARFPVDWPVPTRDVARTHEPVFLRNRQEWEARYSTPPNRDGADGSWAALPLLSGDRLLGALTLSFREPRSFDTRDREYMLALANQCSRALERARLFEAERVARREAEHANRVKSQFLGVMSHELRTPLNAVVGYTELLLLELKGPLTPEQRVQLERIRTAASVQMQLIEEILTFARIEAGRETLRLAETDVSSIVEEVAELLRPLAESSGIAIRTRVAPGPIKIESDPAKLRQVLLNLGGNAVKFTLKGEVGIDVRSAGGTVEIDVWDTGPGIPEDQQELVFEPFSQLDQAHTREHGGTGLGLAITQRLTRLLGGHVRLRSAPGAGCTFTVALPERPPPRASDR